MKTKEELNALKEEVETLNKKLAELTEKNLKQVTEYGPKPPSKLEKMKKRYCRECGFVYEIFPEGAELCVPNGPCPKCKAYYASTIDDA